MRFEYLDDCDQKLTADQIKIEFEDQIRQACGPGAVTEVAVQKLTPGLSGAAVFLVTRLGPAGLLIPWVVKACKDEALLIAERDNFNQLVRDKLPDAPELVRASPRLLIFVFGGIHAHRTPATLRSGYSSSHQGALAVLMRRIVQSLASIHVISADTVSCVRRMPLIAELKKDAQALPLSADVITRLLDAWENALGDAEALPRIRSTAHGDLNSGNILFEPGAEASYPVFIDFASMRRSKDNCAHVEGYYLPFWDFTKLERDIQTRLFLKAAVSSKMDRGDIVASVKALNGGNERTASAEPIEKMIKTTSSFRREIHRGNAPNNLEAYPIVLAYAMMTVLFRKEPDADITQDIQCLVAAEAAITLLGSSRPSSLGSPGSSRWNAKNFWTPETETTKRTIGSEPPIRSFVGREGDVDAVRALLTERQDPRTDKTIIVHGISGVGKSTLARALSRDEQLLSAFSTPVLLTSLGPSPDIIGNLRHLYVQITGRTLPDGELHGAKRELAKELNNSKHLLILDDVWEPSDMSFFPSGGYGSATLVTTRRSDLAGLLGVPRRYEYSLKRLSDDDGFALLDSLAGDAIREFATEAKTLVSELEGLPLALQVAGRLLRAEQAKKYDVRQLLNDLRDGTKGLLKEDCPEDMRDLRSQTLPSVAVLLRKSTDRLDAATKERFAWLGPVAPKPAIFDVDFLRTQWNADDRSVRETLGILIDRGLVEPVGEGEYWMHSLLVALADTLCSP